MMRDDFHAHAQESSLATNLSVAHGPLFIAAWLMILSHTDAGPVAQGAARPFLA
jgi:hypothetical protein